MERHTSKPVVGTPPVAMTTESPSKYAAPLFDFPWRGQDMRIADDLQIGRVDKEAIFTQYRQGLSEVDQQYCRLEDHWLILDHDPSAELKPSEVMNLFLISLWVCKPTRTFLAYRFRTQPWGDVVRLLDRFQWVNVPQDLEITDAELQRAAQFLRLLREAVVSSPRMKAALLLTLQGCMAKQWQVAFICLTSAAEVLLVYSNARNRLVERLALAFAVLVADSTQERAGLRERFEVLYKVRSKIVHEGAYRRDDAAQNLTDLAEFESLLRRLLAKILTDQGICDAIKGNNTARQRLLKARGGLLEEAATCCTSSVR